MRAAAEKYFAQLEGSAELQANMVARLNDPNRGGAFYLVSE
jgi:hypothetical protein